MMLISIRSIKIPTANTTTLFLSLSIPTTQWKKYIFRFGTHLCKAIVELINEYQCFEWLDIKQPLVKCIGCQTDVLSTEFSVSSVNEWILNANDFMNSCSKSRMTPPMICLSNRIKWVLFSFELLSLATASATAKSNYLHSINAMEKWKPKIPCMRRALNTLPICYIVSTNRTVNLVSIIDFKPNSWID